MQTSALECLDDVARAIQREPGTPTRAYGLAPSEYQRQLRVRTARGLLSRGVRPAAAAAEADSAVQAR